MMYKLAENNEEISWLQSAYVLRKAFTSRRICMDTKTMTHEQMWMSPQMCAIRCVLYLLSSDTLICWKNLAT